MTNHEVALLVSAMATAFHVPNLERVGDVYELFCDKQRMNEHTQPKEEWSAMEADWESWLSVFKTIEMDEKVEAWRLEKEQMHNPLIENQQELF